MWQLPNKHLNMNKKMTHNELISHKNSINGDTVQYQEVIII